MKKIDNKVDNKILKLIKLVETNRAEIKQLSRPSWKTNCSFRYNEDRADSINIQTVTNLIKFADMLSFVKMKERFFTEACDDLGIDGGTYKWLGYSVDEWRTDFGTRIDKININSKKKKLEELESRLEIVMSPEIKKKMEIDAIEQEISNLSS